MGCQVSRPSGPPRLPFDIYLEVPNHLRTSLAEDRKTLRALALCCRALRDASQRSLFSSMSYAYPPADFDLLVKTLKSHAKFLRAIIDSPDRLALYVRSYSQQRLALDPKLRSAAKALTLGHRTKRVLLWTLSEMALPLMVNLKNLIISPLMFHPSAPILLRHCTFQLVSFTWTGYESDQALYSTFLPTQRNLLDLDINSCTYNDRPTLPDGLCPFLKSVACPLSALERISTTRPIIALYVAPDISRPPRTDLMSATERDGCIAALRKIRYLWISLLPQFQQFTNGIMLHNVAALRLRVFKIEDPSLLSQFPNLRSLRLSNPWVTDVDTSAFHDTAVHAFNQIPKLQVMVIIAKVAQSDLVWQFSPRYGGGVVEKVTSLENYVDTEWWKP